MTIATSTPLPTLLFAAFATLVVAGCGVTVNLGTDTARRIESDTVAVGDLRMIDIATENGAIEVRATDDDEITIESLFHEHDEGDAGSSIDVDGDRLVVRGECDDSWFEQCSVGFVVAVPASFAVDITTDDGRVELFGIAGDVHVDSDNGAIEGTELLASSVETHTDNGRITLSFDDAPTTTVATTDNGAITIEVPADDADVYDADADSDNGDVDVDVRTGPDSGQRITARSDNGSIGIGYRTT